MLIEGNLENAYRRKSWKCLFSCTCCVVEFVMYMLIQLFSSLSVNSVLECSANIHLDFRD